VQPHLLFEGELLAQVRSAVAARAAVQPERQWLLAPALGVHNLLVRVVLDQIETCGLDGTGTLGRWDVPLRTDLAFPS